MDHNYLIHHGINGQKWGDQNGPPYPLSYDAHSASEKRLNRLDKKFVKKNDKKIRKYAEKSTKDELKTYEKQLRQVARKYNKNGKINANYATAVSKKMADLYNTAIGDIPTPSGKVIKFVAKRGEIGVYTAIASVGYDMSTLKTGVYNTGKIAYKKNYVNVDYED